MQATFLKDSKKPKRIDKQAFKRLTLLYSIAVGSIALVIIISERYLQQQLNNQLYDSKIINITGRQRMYSQKISKDLLLLTQIAFDDEKDLVINDLQNALNDWNSIHYALIHGNQSLNIPKNTDKAINLKFDTLTRIQKSMYGKAQSVLSLAKTSEKGLSQELLTKVKTILTHEKVYLVRMNEIVGLFEEHAKRKVERAKNIQTLLALISLGLLFLEVIIIFRPIAIYVRRHLRALLHSEWLLNRSVQKLESLQKYLQSSNDDLKTVYFALEEAALFARAASNGDIYYISDQFLEKIHFNKKEKFTYNLFKVIDIKEWIQQIETSKNKRSLWKGELKIMTYNESYIWIDTRIVPVFDQQNELEDLLIICNDITDRKWAEQKVYRLNREKYLQKAAEQKANAIRIIEALEKERKRISRDIHDGLGQLLTATKFNLQSINLSYQEKAIQKLNEINEHIADIIQETRKISFNLTPSNLEDYGIASALKALVVQVSKQTGIDIRFINQNQFTGRLQKNLEINIYRISQEAINNAVKHSGSNTIIVNLLSDDQELKITIKDNGRGFDTNKFWENNKHFSAASGILNMKERVSFFKGSFNLETAPSKGTMISITLPKVNIISV